MLVLGAQMELEARSLHISHIKELCYRVESSGESPESVWSPLEPADLFFTLYDIFLAYIDSIWWIRCTVASAIMGFFYIYFWILASPEPLGQPVRSQITQGPLLIIGNNFLWICGRFLSVSAPDPSIFERFCSKIVQNPSKSPIQRYKEIA